MGSTAAMQRHGTERARVNTEERQRPKHNARLRADAGVCPQQANTQEKTLATADLVRDTAFTRTYSVRDALELTFLDCFLLLCEGLPFLSRPNGIPSQHGTTWIATPPWWHGHLQSFLRFISQPRRHRSPSSSEFRDDHLGARFPKRFAARIPPYAL